MILFLLPLLLYNFPRLTLGESTVLFSDVVFKVNRKGRLQERWLMITGTDSSLSLSLNNFI